MRFLPSLRRFLLLAAPCLLAGAGAAGAAEIRFKPQSEVRGSIVLLGDLADIRGADDAEVEALRRMELFPAPGLDQSRTLRIIEIRQLLALQGVPATIHQYQGPAIIRIVGRRAERLVRGSASPNETISRQELIVFTRRPMAQGDIVREADIELRQTERSADGGQFARSLDQVVGWELIRPVGENQPLDVRFARKPLLVAKGQLVSVTAKSAGVRVRTTARAVEGGSSGDLILLESIETKKRYSAVVSGAQQAEVLAGGVSISSPVQRAVSDKIVADSSDASRISRYSGPKADTPVERSPKRGN